jgi:N-glycosylase/DNA lyase
MTLSVGCSVPAVTSAPANAPRELAVLRATEFNLDLTLGCGQVFHWVREGAGWIGAIGEQAVYAEQRDEELLVTSGATDVARSYFALDHDLPEICATFPEDEAMVRAAAFCRGLRLIRQPLWECVATFITSSMKQVAHIAQISHTIRRRFGKALQCHGGTIYAYPSPARMAELEEADLLACSLGYRAKNLLASARMIAAGEVSLEEIQAMPDEEARVALCRLPGVGEKVANCALLFAFERPRAFPIDVWIERVLREIYFRGKRQPKGKALREFSANYFGPHSGYAQQYLFHYARATWPRGERSKARAGKRGAKSASRKRAAAKTQRP